MHRMCIHKKMAQGRTICDGALKKETRREKRESKTAKDSVAGGRYGGTATLPGGPRTSAWEKRQKKDSFLVGMEKLPFPLLTRLRKKCIYNGIVVETTCYLEEKAGNATRHEMQKGVRFCGAKETGVYQYRRLFLFISRTSAQPWPSRRLRAAAA